MNEWFKMTGLTRNHMKKEQIEVQETRQVVDMSKRKNNSKCWLAICKIYRGIALFL